jgi:hypothetical protein
MTNNTAQTKLATLLDRLYKFPHNVDKLELLELVYGPTDSLNAGYKDSKLSLWERRGFTYWYNDLDIANRIKVVDAILARYPELEGML